MVVLVASIPLAVEIVTTTTLAMGSRNLSTKVAPPPPAPPTRAEQDVRRGSACDPAAMRARGEPHGSRPAKIRFPAAAAVAAAGRGRL